MIGYSLALGLGKNIMAQLLEYSIVITVFKHGLPI
jgi:hypothetical protein